MEKRLTGKRGGGRGKEKTPHGTERMKRRTRSRKGEPFAKMVGAPAKQDQCSGMNKSERSGAIY